MTTGTVVPTVANLAVEAREAAYTRTAIILHWAIAALILATIPLGFYGASFETATGQAVTDVHKTIGITILALTLVRVAWRLTHKPAPLPEGDPPILRRIAKIAHGLFYGLLVVLPLSGWWMSSAVPNRHSFGFGPVHIPFLPVPRGWASAGPAHAMHEALAFVMTALAVLHILAALKHQFIDKDEILSRMLLRKD